MRRNIRRPRNALRAGPSRQSAASAQTHRRPRTGSGMRKVRRLSSPTGACKWRSEPAFRWARRGNRAADWSLERNLPMLIRSHHSQRQAELETATMGGQQGPPCQQRPPVNRRKRRIGRKNIGLQREPQGSVLDPGNRVFRPEKTTAPSTREMLVITAASGRDAVNKEGAAIWA